MQGEVKNFNSERGYGFIKPADGGADVFVHVSAVRRAGMEELFAVDRVSFDVVDGKRVGSVQADKLRLVDEAAEGPVRFGT